MSGIKENTMILVLTMAGLYSRFIEEGYKFPKYLLPWGKQTILSKILYEMTRKSDFTDVYLIGNLRDEPYSAHIQAILIENKLNPKNLHFIDDTKGQAETAYIGIKYLEKLKKKLNDPIVFHNIDTILYERDYKHIDLALKNNAGYVDVFSSRKHDYSYVLLRDKNKVIEIAEKTVISNIATSGMYGFSNPQIFRDFYDRNTDLYIANIYKKMIAKNESIVASKIYSEDLTIVLGTPAEYINASATCEMALLA